MSIEYIRKVLMAKELVQDVPVQLTILEYQYDEESDTMKPTFVNWSYGDAGYKYIPVQLR